MATRAFQPSSSAIPRRQFLGFAAVSLLAPMLSLARAATASVTELRALSFLHTHTGEQLSVTYATGDGYVPAALQALNWLLRDFRTGAVHPIDPALFDQLHRLARITGTRSPFQVISGYRSPATNEALRARGGVAVQSLHLEGRAIDLRLADVPLAALRDAAQSLEAGGVGYYPASQFIHMDTGSVRHW